MYRTVGALVMVLGCAWSGVAAAGVVSDDELFSTIVGDELPVAEGIYSCADHETKATVGRTLTARWYGKRVRYMNAPLDGEEVEDENIPYVEVFHMVGKNIYVVPTDYDQKEYLEYFTLMVVSDDKKVFSSYNLFANDLVTKVASENGVTVTIESEEEGVDFAKMHGPPEAQRKVLGLLAADLSKFQHDLDCTFVKELPK